MTSDTELLRRYTDDHAEDAFRQLVQRHLGFVYFTALRRVGHDAQLAEDVAQTVFTALARKAFQLRDRPTLRGWLFVSTQHAAASVVRGEQRRRARENEAQSMQTLVNDSGAIPDPHHLRALLDPAILRLRDSDREAISLRFFENRTFAEVGAALHLSEDAARKRVDRALDKLRLALAARAVTSSAAILAAALGDFALGAAPPGLGAKVAARAFSSSRAIASTLLARAAASIAVLIGTAGMAGVGYQRTLNHRLQAELAHAKGDEHLLLTVRQENLRLLRAAKEADDLRVAATELPALRRRVDPPVAPSASLAAKRATITIEADGTPVWGRQPVTLAELLERLQALEQSAPGGNAKLGIRGGQFGPLNYVITEARKAQIRHVVVESVATPESTTGSWWFDRQ